MNIENAEDECKAALEQKTDDGLQFGYPVQPDENAIWISTAEIATSPEMTRAAIVFIEDDKHRALFAETMGGRLGEAISHSRVANENLVAATNISKAIVLLSDPGHRRVVQDALRLTEDDPAVRTLGDMMDALEAQHSRMSWRTTG